MGCGWGLDVSLSNRETHVESGTNQKDARRKKKAINQTKHNHKKFQNLALKTFFLWREPPLLVLTILISMKILRPLDMPQKSGQLAKMKLGYNPHASSILYRETDGLHIVTKGKLNQVV